MNKLTEEYKSKFARENSKDIHEFFTASKQEIEKARLRKKRIAVSLVILCSFSLIGFVFVSVLWQRSSKLQEEILSTSKANAIATKAYTLLEHDPTLAFRLAEESYKIEPTPLNKQVVMAAYGQVPFYEKLEGHTEGLRNCVISPNGKFIVTGAKDNEFRVFDFNGQCLIILKGHTNMLVNGSNTIAVSSDSKFILTCTLDSTARLWNLKGECLAILKHNGPVNSVCFSPDDQRILTASSDKTARVWDLEGKELTKMEHEKSVTKALFDQDNLKIYSIDGEKIKVWSNGGKFLTELKAHRKPIRDFSISSNGKFLVTASTDTSAILWDIEKFKSLKLLIGHKDYVRWARFSNNDSLILTASKDNTAILWTLDGKEKTVLRGHSAFIWSIGFSPDSNKILTASDDGTARLWDLEGNELMILKGHTSQVFSAQFSPDGKQIVTASGDKTARIWTIEPEENPIFRGHTGYVVDANFSPDGKEIITAGWDYTARIWNSKGNNLLTLKGLSHYAVTQAGFIKNRNLVYGSCDGANGMIWDFHGNLIANIKAHGHYHDMKVVDTNAIFWSSDEGKLSVYNLKGTESNSFMNVSGYTLLNNYLFAFSIDSSLEIYTVLHQMNFKYRKIIKIENLKSKFTSAEFTTGGNWMATTSEDSTIRIWDLYEILNLEKNVKDTSVIKIGTEKVKYQIKLNSGVSSVIFSPKENIFISNSSDNILRLWNTEGKQLAEFVGHSDEITDVNFSPDGNWIITGSSDKSVRLWDLMGNEVQNYPGHQHKVKKTKFSPDGKYILTCSNDHTARLMPVSVEQVFEKINKEKVRGGVYKLSDQDLKVYGVK